MSYNELFNILRGSRGGNDATKPLAMSNFSGLDATTAVTGTLGGNFTELYDYSPSEESISKLESLKTRIDRDLKKLYGVSVPEIATYGVIERNFGLGTSDPSKYCYINATLPNILVYVARGYMPIIPALKDREDMYNQLTELMFIYQEDPMSLVQITLDDELMSAIVMLKEYIEENYKSMFIKPKLPEGSLPRINGLSTGLSDGLFTSDTRSLLGSKEDLLEAAKLADGSMESNFQGEDVSFGTDALSVYLNK